MTRLPAFLSKNTPQAMRSGVHYPGEDFGNKLKKNVIKEYKNVREEAKDVLESFSNSSMKKRRSHSSHKAGRRGNRSNIEIAGHTFDRTTTYLVMGYVGIFILFAIYLAISGGLGDGNRPENMIVNSVHQQHVQPGNPVTGGGWNDTPTIGMTGEHTMNKDMPQGVMAEQRNTSVTHTTPAPGGMPATSPKYCTTPTGFLMRAVQAYNQGLREGIVNMDGVSVDMGSNGAFYDRWGDGCCDAYCRIVTKGNYWSCIDPETRTSQYLQSLPRGRKCEKYGNERNVLIQ